MSQGDKDEVPPALLPFTASDYAAAGRRANTERSYAEGVRHFEET